MRKFISLTGLPAAFHSRLQAHAASRRVACFLNSNSNEISARDPYSRFEWCAAIDAVEEMSGSTSAFNALGEFHARCPDWLFGFFTYDLKNETEHLISENHDGLGFPSIHFFRPEFIFMKDESGILCGYLPERQSEKKVLELIEEISASAPNVMQVNDTVIRQRVSREDYLNNVGLIRKHIQRGDIYEMNYCIEFFSENAEVDAGDLYRTLNELSPMPFSCYYKTGHHHLSCASPERFIAKRGNKIISQPIKGTSKRGKTKEEDELFKWKLRNDHKEQSENVMIVDLVRNDLSRTAARKSVKVEELFGIYTFRQLHQMISTVVSEIHPGIHWSEVIRNAFPMGSMTGAPKIRAMQLIEEYENSMRGLYSGATGYITPEGDFDFNVVIRSILYNQKKKYLSFTVGSAITISSDAEKEYDECMLKAKAMMQVLKPEISEKVS